jgi:hypothetical protein
MLARQTQHSIEPGVELGSLGIVGVVAEGFLAPECVRRLPAVRSLATPAAERRRVTIGDAGVTQGRRQRLGIEMRIPARHGKAAHIDHAIDGRVPEQREKFR